jgi:hypothetical protein
MNKRIQELAEQCTTIYNPTTFPVDKDFDYEKFAELMVRECAEFVNYYHSRNEPVTPQQILRHFGVEE